MSPGARRILITVVVLLFAGGIIASVVFSPKRGAQSSPDDKDNGTELVQNDDASSSDDNATPTETNDGSDAETNGNSGDGEPPSDDEAAQNDSSGESDAGNDATASPDPGEVVAVETLRVRPVDPATQSDAPAVLGSLNPNEAAMEVTFAPTGAGIERIALSKYWLVAPAGRAAKAHYEALAEGEAEVPPLPDESLRYILQAAQDYEWMAEEPRGSGIWVSKRQSIPVLSAHSIKVNDTSLNLIGEGIWSQESPGTFRAVIENAAGEAVLDVVRSFTLDGDGELSLLQHIENRSGQTLTVQWIQYGPGELQVDRSRYMDRRRFRFGPQIQTGTDPVTYDVLPNENDLLIERTSKVKDFKDGNVPSMDDLTLWPNEDAVDAGYDLAWFASSNRYFVLAVHKLVDDQIGPTSDKSIDDVIQSVRIQASLYNEGVRTDDPLLFTVLIGQPKAIPAGGSVSLDLGVYAGPLDPEILSDTEPFATLRLGGLILYQMSSFCAICTFQWLAHLLLGFLGLLHGIAGDYGIAIIGLVLVVRTLLHPLVKRSQINMQRFSRGMAKMKPELDKIQKKYAGDQKRMQAEQMRLMREHNVNPLQMLGCLPMFLQTPIWIALYAGLYFAIELRHEPAFYGVFQSIAGWPFLADLSSADHFFGEFETPRQILFWNVTGINLLPIMMGVVMYISQKYMSPPPSAAMTEQQASQQKMMRIIFPLILPIAMYSAPSGLTLYIMTSTTIGILESRYIRKHVDELDKQDENPDQYINKKRKLNKKDPHARAYAAAVERAKEKRQAKQQKNFKKRK